MTRQPSPLVILGCGYCGRFLYNLVITRHRFVRATSRNPLKNLAGIPSERHIAFDLEHSPTWPNIPAQTDLIWCFPATPLDLVQRFAVAWQAPPRRLVVLGSTSAYDVVQDQQDYPPLWIDESAPLNRRIPRVQGEEYLRRHHGAIVLRVAGIYGPDRNPLDWIRAGRVTASRKYVNLIHVEDLAAICLAALERGKPGEIYNVSDGTPRTWAEICETAQARWRITAQAPVSSDEAGKRLSIKKLRDQLACPLRYPDLYAALEELVEPAC